MITCRLQCGRQGAGADRDERGGPNVRFVRRPRGDAALRCAVAGRCAFSYAHAGRYAFAYAHACRYAFPCAHACRYAFPYPAPRVSACRPGLHLFVCNGAAGGLGGGDSSDHPRSTAVYYYVTATPTRLGPDVSAVCLHVAAPIAFVNGLCADIDFELACIPVEGGGRAAGVDDGVGVDSVALRARSSYGVYFVHPLQVRAAAPACFPRMPCCTIC